MKNFYDLQDIDEVNIHINIDLVVNNISDMNMYVILNGIELYNGSETTSLSADIGVNDVFDLEIHVNNMDGCNSVYIKDISADDINIMPTYNYLAKYSNIIGRDTSTNILEFDGIWSINTVVPLLHWIHDVKGNGWLLHPMKGK